MKLSTTSRGFLLYEGIDRYDARYTLQESSLAEEACIWLGQSPVPIMQVGWHPMYSGRARQLSEEEAKAMGLYTTGRMHLTQEMAAELIPLLRFFVETGNLPRESDKS